MGLNKARSKTTVTVRLYFQIFIIVLLVRRGFTIHITDSNSVSLLCLYHDLTVHCGNYYVTVAFTLDFPTQSYTLQTAIVFFLVSSLNPLHRPRHRIGHLDFTVFFLLSLAYFHLVLSKLAFWSDFQLEWRFLRILISELRDLGGWECVNDDAAKRPVKMHNINTMPHCWEFPVLPLIYLLLRLFQNTLN